MTQAGGNVKEEVWRAFIVLLTNAPELHAYAARSLFRALRDHLAHAELSLLATATWYIGASLSTTQLFRNDSVRFFQIALGTMTICSETLQGRQEAGCKFVIVRSLQDVKLLQSTFIEFQIFHREEPSAHLWRR